MTTQPPLLASIPDSPSAVALTAANLQLSDIIEIINGGPLLAGATLAVLKQFFGLDPVIFPARVVISGATVTMGDDDFAVLINKTVGSATAVVLPPPSLGRMALVKDAKGDAAANPITLTVPAGGTIDGQSSRVMNANEEAVFLIGASDVEWAVISDLQTLQSLLNALSSSQGAIIQRGASAWEALTQGGAGQVLTSPGDGTRLFWGTPTAVAGSIFVLSGAASSDGLAYTATAPVGYTGAVGSIIVFTVPTANVGNVTLNISAGGAKDVLTNGGAAIPAALLQNGRSYIGRVQGTTQIRLLEIDITQAYTQTQLYRSGVQRAQISVTANNELSFQSWVSGAMVEVARFDTATGNLRVFFQAGYGATAGGFAPFYSFANPQPFVLDDAHYDAIAATASNATLFEFMDQYQPYALSSTAPYYMSGGDNMRPILVSASGAYLDATFFPLGGVIEVTATSGGSFSLYCGAGNQWRGFSSSQLTLGFAASQVVRVHRYSQTDYWAEVALGSAATPSTGAAPIRDKTGWVLGQSNAVKLLSGGGLAGIQAGFASLAITDEWWWVNSASGESALIKGNQAVSNPTNYWWDTVGNVPGPLATQAVVDINAAIALGQPAPSLLIWDQGERDAPFMATSGLTTPATYLAAENSLFSYIRTQVSLPTLTILIVPLGADDSTAFDPGKTSVREAQLKYIASDAHAVQGPDRYDLSRPASNVHLNYAGQNAEGVRMASHIGNLFYGQSNFLGLYLVSWTQLTSTTFKAVLDPGVNKSLLNAGNPTEAVGFQLLSNADAMSAVLYPTQSISQFFNAGTGYQEFTFTTSVPASGARLSGPYGACAIGRTGRILKGAVNGIPFRSYGVTP